MSTNEAILFISAPEIDANLFYACQFLAPDPIIFLQVKNRKTLILSDLEIDRAKSEASVHSILSYSDLLKNAQAQNWYNKYKKNISPYALVVHHFLKSKNIRRITVPSTFPSQYYEFFIKLDYKIKVKSDPFWEKRLIKSEIEKKNIRKTVIQVEKVLAETVKILQNSKIKRNKIYHGKELVTSEYLHSFINSELMKRNCVAHSTIVASGEQGSLPHHHGSGPIIPHTPIIFDIFPRHAKTMYWGDMTRTMVKGKPSDTVKKMYQAVLAANKNAARLLKHGVNGMTVHQQAVNTLEKYGFKTGKIDGQMQGFIHSTGHGLGLDIHELPSVSTRDVILKKGNVVTIEPGLYYKKHGGIRIEDDHFITKTGSEKLTKFPYFLEID